MSEFFTPEPEFWHANDVLYKVFSSAHLTMLAPCVAAIVALVWVYRRADDPARKRLLRIYGTLPVVMLASRDVTLVALGMFEPHFYPLHICNFSEFAVLAYVWLPEGAVREWLGDLVFFWALPGGVGALIFPGWRYCPLWSYASVCGYMEHLLLATVALCALQGGQLRPRVRDLPVLAALVVLGGGVFRLLNPGWGTNFFFVTNPQAVGGPFTLVYNLLGDPAWLVGYVVCVVALWLMEWAIWYACLGKRQIRS